MSTTTTLPATQQPKHLPALPDQMPLTDIIKLGEVFEKSGFFDDARSASQAVVKILAGRELGFGPMASMTGISIIEGKPSIGANMMAAMIRRSERYDYRIIKHDDQVCEIEFLRRNGQHWNIEGVAGFTIQEAIKAGKTASKNWQKYPKDMLFARAISRGYKRFCPDLSVGMLCYVDDELDAEVMPNPSRAEAVVADQPHTNGIAIDTTQTDTAVYDDGPCIQIQRERIIGIAQEIGMQKEDLAAILLKRGKSKLSELTYREAEGLIDALERKQTRDATPF